MVKASRFFNELRVRGFYPTTETLNIVLEGFCSNNTKMDALTFFREELNNSFTPDATSYRYLIEKFVKDDSKAGARALMAESLRKGASDPGLLKKQQKKLRGGRVHRYPPGGRNDGGGGLGSVLNDDDIGNVIQLCGDATGISQPIPIGALASALANASPTEQKTILGENLLPLVEQLKVEGEAAAKITGMLLEMDHSEVLHLLESPEALKAKVAEAMEVLTNVSQQQPGIPANQLASLSLNDNTDL